MIVDRILDYLGGPNRLAEIPPNVLDAAAEQFRRSLARNLSAQRDRTGETERLRPSSPWYCPRRVFYGMTGAKREASSARSYLAFLMGDTLEAVVLTLAKVAGVPLLSPSSLGEQKKVAIEIGGQEVRGSIDASIEYQGEEIPIDVKSMSSYSFDEFVRATQDPTAPWWTSERWGYLSQLRFYMRALGQEQRRNVDDGGKPHASTAYGIFVAVNKDTGHLAEMFVPFDGATHRMFDRAVPAAYKAADEKVEPARPEWAVLNVRPGANSLPDGSKGPCEEVGFWRCSYCPFVTTCFPGVGLVAVGKKPAWRRPLVAGPACQTGE